jgi:hypothetical protein
MATGIPNWKLSGDWFDVCKCSIPCPCEFAQTPTYGECDGVLAYHIKNGEYGKIPLTGLNVIAIGDFKGNIWAGNTKINFAMYFDERASEEQRDALANHQLRQDICLSNDIKRVMQPPTNIMVT